MTKMIGGRAQHGAQTYDGMHTGTILVGANAVPISAVTVGCYEVLVQADPSNGANVVIGNDKQGCTIVMAAGSFPITIKINDVAKMRARAVAGTQRINWMAMV